MQYNANDCTEIQFKFDKLWTDYESEYDSVLSICPLPIGSRGLKCPKCGSKELTGALITPNADEQDPNDDLKSRRYRQSILF